MKTRKILTGILSVLLTAAVLYALAKIQYEYGNFGINRIDEAFFKYEVIQSLLFSLLGLLVTKNWFEYFMRGGVKINTGLLVCGIALFALGAVPFAVWVIHLGLAGRIYITILSLSLTNYAMSLMSGVLIGRAFSHKNNEPARPSSDLGGTA